MSRISSVIRNKNRREKIAKQNRQQRLQDLKSESVYRASLTDEIQRLDLLLNDTEVSSIRVCVPKEHLSKFMRCIYGGELTGYSIIQVEDNVFDISRKMITF